MGEVVFRAVRGMNLCECGCCGCCGRGVVDDVEKYQDRGGEGGDNSSFLNPHSKVGGNSLGGPGIVAGWVDCPIYV